MARHDGRLVELTDVFGVGLEVVGVDDVVRLVGGDGGAVSGRRNGRGRRTGLGIV